MEAIEFIVIGRPPSHKARGARKERWRTTVGAAAHEAMAGAAPTGAAVFFSVVNYYVGEAPDVDNILKTTQDVLEGIVYCDDGQIVATLSMKRPIADTIVVSTMRTDLRLALLTGRDFIHVKVSVASDPHYELR
jgi:hypothetical protein